MSEPASEEPSAPSRWPGARSPARSSPIVTTRGRAVPQRHHTGSSAPLASNAALGEASPEGLRHRRPSIVERLGSLAHVGGMNSFNNFASSWQRAAGFLEISHRSSQRFDQENVEGLDDVEDRTPAQPIPGRSVLGTALGGDRAEVSESAIADDFLATSPDVGARLAEHRRQSFQQSRSIFGSDSHVGSPAGTSYAASYGVLASSINEPAKRRADRLYSEQQRRLAPPQPTKETEPLLAERVDSAADQPAAFPGGQSTLPQTIFNSVNVLIGVGMLSLPLAFRFSGWLIGMVFFFLSAVTTSYTVRLLAKCIDVDTSLVTFADIAYISFGHRARVVISILFSLELIAACVALVILFADSVNLLVSGWGVTFWKVICGGIMIPLSFLPLRFLSFTSILGILSCMLIVLAVFVDGFLKPTALGSLRDPAPTHLFPENWGTLPLAFGLLMAPWGGHSVFPNIYRDMRHPQKYNTAVMVTYVFTFILESAISIAGYLMFGEGVRDEITANIFLTTGYPKWLSIVILIAIAVIPLTKIPLNSRPIISTAEIFLGVDARAMGGSNTLSGMSNLTRGILRFTVRIIVPIILVLIAILVPSFDRVMSLLGSMACFTICIVLPCAFHLKIFGKDIGIKQRVLDWSLIVLCTILAIVGTICSFLPKKLLGAE